MVSVWNPVKAQGEWHFLQVRRWQLGDTEHPELYGSSPACADPRSLFTQVPTQIRSPPPPRQAGSAGGTAQSFPRPQKRHWRLIFGASLNAGRQRPAGRCAGPGRRARPRRLPLVESTRRPLHRCTGTGLLHGAPSTSAALHPFQLARSPPKGRTGRDVRRWRCRLSREGRMWR